MQAIRPLTHTLNFHLLQVTHHVLMQISRCIPPTFCFHAISATQQQAFAPAQQFNAIHNKIPVLYRYTVSKFIWAPSTSHESIMSCMKGKNSGINLRLTAIIALLEIPIIPFETWCESMNLCKLRGACGRCCLFYNMADEGEKKARTSFRKFTYRSALQRRAWVQ